MNKPFTKLKEPEDGAVVPRSVQVEPSVEVQYRELATAEKTPLPYATNVESEVPPVGRDIVFHTVPPSVDT
jgi:hypothetical protein